MKKTLDDIIIISKINLLNLRESAAGFIVISLFIPLGMTYLISLATPDWNLDTKINYLTGMLVLSSSLTVINGVGQFITMDRIRGVISWYRTSPIHPFSYIFGVTSTYMISILIECLILIPIASILWSLPINIIYFITLIFVILLESIALIGIGAIIGTRSKNIQMASAITNLISFIIVFATPAYYSINIIPKELQPILYVLPTTEASLIIKNLYFQSEINILLILLVLLDVIYSLIGFGGIKWREK
jgi:ABC-2 type transport system permease protein